MSLTDPIADAITMIRNALRAKKENVEIPNSRMSRAVVGILKKEGYIDNFKLLEESRQGVLRVYLKYAHNKPAIRGLKRISKASRRVYTKGKTRMRVLGGLGLAIISTSQGIMTDKEAREKNIGGEVICNIW